MLATPLANQALGSSAYVPGGKYNGQPSSNVQLPAAGGRPGAGTIAARFGTGAFSSPENLPTLYGSPGSPSSTSTGVWNRLLTTPGQIIGQRVTPTVATPTPAALAQNQAQNALAYYQAMYAPQQAQLAQQAADIALQRGIGDQRYSTNQAYLQGKYNNDLALLTGEQGRNVGLKQADLDALNQYLDANYGVDQRILNTQTDYIKSQQGNLSDQFMSLLNNIKAQQGFADQSNSLAKQIAGSQYQNSFRNMADEAASRGAFASTGVNQNLNALADTQNQAFAQADQTREQALSDLEYQRQKANNDFGAQTNALYNQDANARLGFEKTTNQYTKDKSDAANQQAYLDSLANDYGIQQDQLKLALKNGMDNLGLDYATTMGQLANASTSNNAQQAAAAAAITQQVMANAASFPTQSQFAKYGYQPPTGASGSAGNVMKRYGPQ